jgi:hypothetical protein
MVRRRRRRVAVCSIPHAAHPREEFHDPVAPILHVAQFHLQAVGQPLGKCWQKYGAASEPPLMYQTVFFVGGGGLFHEKGEKLPVLAPRGEILTFFSSTLTSGENQCNTSENTRVTVSTQVLCQNLDQLRLIAGDV